MEKTGEICRKVFEKENFASSKYDKTVNFTIPDIAKRNDDIVLLIFICFLRKYTKNGFPSFESSRKSYIAKVNLVPWMERLPMD